MNKKEILKELLNNRYAHRGLHDKPIVPENSMTAFEKATREGFGIELDLHLTKDEKLAVIHDASLERTCGVDLIIEELTLEEAQGHFLEKSQEPIPDFEEVLAMVDGKIPLIIELKVEKSNYDRLCTRLVETLSGYKGIYCIESFDPRAVKWFYKNKPEIVRGQLAGALKKGGFKMSPIKDFIVRNLLVNIASKPDFVAYKFEDRFEKAFRKYNGPKFLWTIKKYSDLKEAEALGAAPIFEQFNPKEYE